MGGCCAKTTTGVEPMPADRWAAPRMMGKPRPTLDQLRLLNAPGSDEVGGETHAFGDDKTRSAVLRSGKSCLDILVKNTVLVAVRVRPLNQRETSAGSAACLDFEGTTGLTVKRDGEKDVRFAFDCVMRQDVAQRDVFDRSARPLLHKVFEGYNGCLFAYGQTGSGKTYTMQGADGEHRGVIPLLCTELFDQIKALKATKAVTVACSALEIYNEKVKDLVAPDGEDLQIREDPSPGGRGIHVDGLAETPVASYADVSSLLEKAQTRRAVGQTNMNEQSSRSHSVVTLSIAARDRGDEAGDTITVSKLHLVDLAGSERQKATGATGDRLKEGAQINKSLSALGNVINALTEAKGRHIPYRDSKLTRLLQDSLGGNSFTVMICNVSPAKISAEETLSSLRFAERAKRIENQAKVNRDPKSERILELMQENKVMRAKITRLEAHIVRLEANY